MYFPRQFSLSPPSSPLSQLSSSDEAQLAPIRPKIKREEKRPKTYKVEKTPLIASDGFRHCNYCQGHVRPQMCGSRKHRWRCVDKRCRKWYGWVMSTEDMPADIYSKGRWNSVFGTKPKKEIEPKEVKTPKKKVIKKEITSSPERMNNFDALFEEEVRRATASLQPSEKKKKNTPNRRQSVPDLPIREFSPLTTRERNYVPSLMEKRSRWWSNGKRKRYSSPERAIGNDITDVAAAFRMCALACSTAAVTRANEMQSINGALDLLMDSLFGCMGPLLSLATKLPGMNTDPQLVHDMWESSCVHLPTFH